jgi:hypothetical protein
VASDLFVVHQQSCCSLRLACLEWALSEERHSSDPPRVRKTRIHKKKTNQEREKAIPSSIDTLVAVRKKLLVVVMRVRSSPQVPSLNFYLTDLVDKVMEWNRLKK